MQLTVIRIQGCCDHLKKHSTCNFAFLLILSGKPQYTGRPAPPSRFGIKPGHRWDGVDRSNGYEKQYFGKMSENAAIKEHAYKWSTEEM